MKGFNLKKFCMKYLLVILFVIAVICAFNYLTSFQENFEASNELVLFHMNGCGHCKKLMPEWKKFEANNNSEIKTRAVEVNEDPDLIKKHKVDGFPTILLLGENGKKLDTYDGPRTADGLLSYCNKN